MNAPDSSTQETCTRCKNGQPRPVIVDAVYNHEGVAVSYKDEFMRCDNCDREYYTTEQSMARSRAITAALRSHQGFLSGESIREVRLSYEMSLPEFERALGVGKNTVGRWERGTVPPTGAANFGLWVAANAPEVFEKWAKLRGLDIKRRSRPAMKTAASTSQAPSAPFTVVKGGLALKKSVRFRQQSNVVLVAAGETT